MSRNIPGSEQLALPVSLALQKHGFVDLAKSHILSSLLNAAALMGMPVMLTGPGTGRIIRTFCSASGFDRLSTITLGHGWDGAEFKSALSGCSEVVRVDNVFSPGYSDTLLTAAAESGRTVFIDYPFWDDIAMHPKGLFNFVLPVLTEMYVARPFIRDDTMQRSPSCPLAKADLTGQSLSLPGYFAELGLSASTLSNLEMLLGIAAELYRKLLPVNISNDQAVFNIITAGALAPLSQCTGNAHLLQHALSSPLLFPAVREMIIPLIKAEGLLPDDGLSPADDSHDHDIEDMQVSAASLTSGATSDTDLIRQGHTSPLTVRYGESRRSNSGWNENSGGSSGSGSNGRQIIKDNARVFRSGQEQHGQTRSGSSMSRLLGLMKPKR